MNEEFSFFAETHSNKGPNIGQVTYIYGEEIYAWYLLLHDASIN